MDSARIDCTPGVDWITVRADLGPPARHLFQRVRALQGEQVDSGNRIKPWGVAGYVGHAVRHIRYGVKAGAVRVELSGDQADRYWREVLEHATQVRRFDTKVDVTFPRDVGNLAQQAFDAPGRPLGRNLPAIAKTLWTGSAGGHTCYVGAMGGSRLGRLYDKSAESRGEYPDHTWRWELQERDALSDITARNLGCADDVPRAIAAYVRSFYAGHGVTPWFKADRIALSAIARRSPTDVSAYKSWLRDQVAPGVRRWSDRGYRHAIAGALNLSAAQLWPAAEVTP